MTTRSTRRSFIIAGIASLVAGRSAQARRNRGDRVITIDGVTIQAEYRDFYLRHRHDPRLYVIPDDRSVILWIRRGYSFLDHTYHVNIIHPTNITRRRVRRR